MKPSRFFKAAVLSTLSLGTLVAALSTPASASSYIQTRSIDFAGSACAAASVRTSGNATTIFVFNRWKTVGNDRAHCSISIPVKVPKGMQVGLPTVTYTGTSTPALLTSEVFFAGDLTTAKKLKVRNNFSTTDKTIAWSGCGEDVNIRVNAALMTDYGTGRISSMILSQLPTRRCR